MKLLILLTALQLNVKNLKSEIHRNRIKHPDIVLRQAILETGWFDSYNCTERNNIFGFRTSEYLVFDSWQDCVRYYKDWQDRKYKGGCYYQFLKDVGYASDLEYIEKLKHIKI
jgi:flagellum-specific peptidoglycan hydrolase FlgJ